MRTGASRPSRLLMIWRASPVAAAQADPDAGPRGPRLDRGLVVGVGRPGAEVGPQAVAEVAARGLAAAPQERLELGALERPRRLNVGREDREEAAPALRAQPRGEVARHAAPPGPREQSLASAGPRPTGPASGGARRVSAGRRGRRPGRAGATVARAATGTAGRNTAPAASRSPVPEVPCPTPPA